MTDEEVLRAQAAFAAVEALPFRPRLRAAGVWARVKGAADLFGHNLPAAERVLVALNPYPHPFRLVSVPVQDGGVLAAWLGATTPGAPGLVLAPGTFHTKDDTARKAKAIRIWRSWGWNVLALDLRGFGGSWALEGSGGLLEADDLLDAARWLRETTGCGPVTLVGESLGGAATLNAAARPEARAVLDAAVAWSPFSDLAEVVRHVTLGDARRNPQLAATQRAYRVLVWARSHGRYRAFDQYLRDRAVALGVDVEELLARASPARHVADVRVPTLVVHAEDDPVVPVAHARRLAEAAASNPRVRVKVLPSGGHLLVDVVDPDWYWAALEAFPRRFAERAPAPGAAGGAVPA